MELYMYNFYWYYIVNDKTFEGEKMFLIYYLGSFKCKKNLMVLLN